MSNKEEIHDALCPALIGGKCDCTESPVTVDKAWSQFCGGIGRGPDAPYPGMIEAFENHYGQSFTDKDWRSETGIWAAAWGYATRQAGAAPVPEGWRLVSVEALTKWRDAFAEELSAWDIDPPLHHVLTSHDEISAILAAAPKDAP